MSDSTTKHQKTPNSTTGAAKVKVAPLSPDRYATVNRNYSNGKSGNGVVPENGVVPLLIPASKDNTNSPMAALSAAIPDVMAAEKFAEPVLETVEQHVQRMRPKTLWMQLRFLYTLLFALWLFGRLVFWQAYVAKIFPDWVNNGNTARWRKYAREFRKFALRMGGVQIKAGQFASTRADILPEAVIAELAGLQDKVPTIAFKQIRAVLVDELGNLDERFDAIEEIPVAAASLGQVHRPN
jgi:hypothetical protein